MYDNTFEVLKKILKILWMFFVRNQSLSSMVHQDGDKPASLDPL
jgi:hypothetical protein